MPNAPLRAALDIAGNEHHAAIILCGIAPDRPRCRKIAANAIIAFLRALPDGAMVPISPAHVRGISGDALRALADALERMDG